MLELAYHVQTAGGYTSVPSPADGDPSIPWFWDWCALHLAEWASDGITDLLTPPPGLSQSGTYPTGDGYGALNPFYALDGTRFGSLASFRRFVSMAHTHGLRVHVDLVLHQRDGGDNGVYKFPGSDPKILNGRWPLTPDCFVGAPPRGPRDPIPSPGDDFGFGDECRYAPAYMSDGAVAAVDWLFESTGADGGRIDDTKALNVPFVDRLLNSRSMASKWFVGEYYDGNPQNLNWWVWNSGMQGRSSTFDFSIRWPLQRMCNSGGNWDMRQLAQTTFSEMCPYESVGFLENHDTDLSFPCIWNKLLGYAVLSGWPGLFGIFGRDYYEYTNCYGLRPEIANLIWIRNMFANGPMAIRQGDDYNIFAFERTGSGGLPGALWAINNKMGSLGTPADWQPLKVQTAFSPGTRLHDYSPQGADDVHVNGDGTVTVWVPPNENGRGYVIYAPDGHQGSVPYVPQGWDTEQMFEGALDLPGNAGEVARGGSLITGSIWCEADSPVRLQFEKGAGLHAWLVDSAGHTCREDAAGDVVMTAIRGEHHLCVTSAAAGDRIAVPSAASSATEPFTLRVTYRGLRKLEAADWQPAVVHKPLAAAAKLDADLRALQRQLSRGRRLKASQ